MTRVFDRMKAIAGWKLMAGVAIAFLALTVMFNDIGQRRYAATTTISSLRPSFVHYGDEKVVTQLRAGETYYINFRISYPVICERVTIQNRLTKPGPENGMIVNGMKVFDRAVYYNYPPAYGAVQEPGIYELNEAFQLPNKLPPGIYTHQRFFFVTCNGYNSTEMFTPVTFEIIP